MLRAFRSRLIARSHPRDGGGGISTPRGGGVGMPTGDDADAPPPRDGGAGAGRSRVARPPRGMAAWAGSRSLVAVVVAACSLPAAGIRPVLRSRPIPTPPLLRVEGQR